MSKRWSSKEIEYLEDKWGYIAIDSIATHLGRTKKAVRIKAKRLRLRGATLTSEFVTANQASKILGIDRHTITDCWIPKYGLKAKKQNRTGNREFWYIRLSELVKWLEKNKDKWDSRKVELYALGEEPKWLKEKRNSDKEIPYNRFYKYTKEEDSLIVCLFKKGCNYKQIADRVNRSQGSIERRLSRLDVWGTGKFKGLK